MKVLNYIIIFVCQFFVTLLDVQFLSDFLKRKNNRSWLIFYVVIDTAIPFTVNELYHIPLLNFFTGLILLGLTTMAFKGKWQKKVLLLAGCNILGAVCEYLAYLLVLPVTDNGSVYAAANLLTVLLFWLCERGIHFVKNAVQKRETNEYDLDSFRKSGWLVAVPACSLVILVCMTYSGIRSNYLSICGITLLILCLLTFYMYHVAAESEANRIRNQMLENQIEAYRHELDLIERTEQRVEEVRHDLRHHIIELSGMVRNGEYEILSDYLESMEKDLNGVKKYARSGKYEIDSLINYMLDAVGEQLKDVHVKITIPEDLEVDRYRLNIILGNLLENAIDAASDSDEKFLSLEMSVRQNVLYLNLENSYSGNIIIINNHIETTKRDRIHHGLGLGNVRRMVEELEGSMLIRTEGGRFIVKVIIYL